MEHLTKEEYDFYIYRKITMWVREQHTIEAESLDEAKKEMIERYKDSFSSETFKEQEFLFDTIEDIDSGDNGGEPTVELYTDDNKLLTTNID